MQLHTIASTEWGLSYSYKGNNLCANSHKVCCPASLTLRRGSVPQIRNNTPKPEVNSEWGWMGLQVSLWTYSPSVEGIWWYMAPKIQDASQRQVTHPSSSSQAWCQIQSLCLSQKMLTFHQLSTHHSPDRPICFRWKTSPGCRVG